MSHFTLAKIAQHGSQLADLFAQTEHDSGLGEQAASKFRSALRVAEHVERAGVVAARPRLFVEPRHGFDIVVEDLDRRFGHRLDA